MVVLCNGSSLKLVVGNVVFTIIKQDFNMILECLTLSIFHKMKQKN